MDGIEGGSSSSLCNGTARQSLVRFQKRKHVHIRLLCSFSSFQTPADTTSNIHRKAYTGARICGIKHTQTPTTYTVDDSSYKYHRTRVCSDSYTIFYSNRHTASGQSRVYRVTQLRTDGVHCKEPAGTRPVNLNVYVTEYIII